MINHWSDLRLFSFICEHDIETYERRHYFGTKTPSEITRTAQRYCDFQWNAHASEYQKQLLAYRQRLVPGQQDLSHYAPNLIR
jgi:hypothetical protein